MQLRGSAVSGTIDDFVVARGPALWRAAWLLTGEASSADDLLQTALAKSWRHFERVNADGSFEAYVRRVLVTTYASWWRRKWRGEVPAADLPETRAAGADVDTRHDVRRALAELSRQQRAVVVLRYFEDMTEQEAAATLGISVGSVKSHHTRAIAKLRASSLLDSLVEEGK